MTGDRLTVVSAADGSHAAALGNLLRSLALCGVRARTVVYDLGLGDERAREIAARCDDLRRFPFERYPAWVDIRASRGEYAWKPIIVAEVVDETGGPVLWLDAGNLVFGDLQHVGHIIRTEGFYSPFSSRTIADWTHPETLRYLHVEVELLGKRNRNGAIVGLDPRRAGMACFARTWRKLALVRECIAPLGSNRQNHRQDQALLSVLAYQFQSAFHFDLVHVPIDVATHQDRVPADGVDATIARLARNDRWRRPIRNVLRMARTIVRKWRRGRRVRPPRAAPGVGRRKPPARPRVALIGHGSLPIPPDGWGSVERVIWNLHKDHAHHGFESVVVNTKDYRELVRQLDEIAPDLIHLHAEMHIDALAPYLISRRIPMVLTSHDSRLQWSVPENVRKAARVASGIIAASPLIHERLIELGFAPVFYVPNGVDATRFRPLEKRPNTVIAIGKNLPRKKLPEIARFFLARPEYQLTICGPETDLGDPRRPQIPRGANVTVLGNQSEAEIVRRLGESEFFVHLGGIEASALVVREAMAAGCKVWTVPYNAHDLENVALYWEDAVRERDLGERARREAVDVLDWSHIVERTVAVYREVLARWSG